VTIGPDSATEQAYFTKGWYRFAYDPVLAQWIELTLEAARSAVAAPENAEWLRCGGTWFAGVNVLPNNAFGAVAGGTAVAGQAIDFVRGALGQTDPTWDRAQVSVVYPGYPLPMVSESTAAYHYRRDRDAAHLDGVLRVGPQKRRHLREHHAFILGIPMVQVSTDASPLVVWEGSHDIVRRRFRDYLRDTPPADWPGVDITELYQATRKEIFVDCPRVTITARPGEAYLVHRLALHGIAPWTTSACTGPDGRMIVYFRPDIGGAQPWLFAR